MPTVRSPQNIATIILPNQTHVVIKRAFSRRVGNAIQNIFETESAYIYGSGKPVTNIDDLNWISEPDRSKALSWYKSGEKVKEKVQLDEVGELKRQIEELKGQLMGQKSLEEKVVEKKVEEKKAIPKKKDGKGMSEENKQAAKDRMRKYWADKKANRILATPAP